jgi:hypothetical protein
MTFWNWLNAVRRNHALEHATVAVLLSQVGPSPRLVGRAVPDGFYIYGRIPTEVIRRSAQEGLARLQRGESQLAVTPLCGTNLAVAGVISGTLAVLAMGKSRRLDRLPSVFLSATAGILLSQPAGRLLQRYVTTRPDLGATSLKRIERSFGGLVHKVVTSGS